MLEQSRKGSMKPQSTASVKNDIHQPKRADGSKSHLLIQMDCEIEQDKPAEQISLGNFNQSHKVVNPNYRPSTFMIESKPRSVERKIDPEWSFELERRLTETNVNLKPVLQRSRQSAVGARYITKE